MKQFNNTAILTSKNPEAFLNFTFNVSDYYIVPDCCIGAKILYVNGLDINKYTPSIGYALKLDATNNIASFHVYTDINYKVNLFLRTMICNVHETMVACVCTINNGET